MVAGATTFPPQFGGAAKGKRLNGQARRLTSPHLEVLCRTSTRDYKAPLCGELLMKGLLCGALLSHRPAGRRWCRKAPKGGAFPTPAGRLYGFRRQRRHKKWRPRAPYLPSGTVLHTSRGRSPQPVREASADPGQNPGSPGPKGPAAGSTLTPVRACQPSGIPESTAQGPAPIPTAPQAPEPSSPIGLSQRYALTLCVICDNARRPKCLFLLYNIP